ncbi:proteophosphoglycan ppg4 [Rhodotorula toruloides]|uniref:Proteophosphoglycan ppg4 n=1 Tax=Rhodotorula toruloides TaxID=5286 RepID=A0A511KK59_RHOTO|nr:proteophosphoglycan ppg4 [Rhodotorula toruloides]
MLFSRLALVSLLGVAVSALSTTSVEERRLSIDVAAHVSTGDILAPLHGCIDKIKTLGAEIVEAVETVKDVRDAKAVVAAVGPILVEVNTVIHTTAHDVLSIAAKRNLAKRSVDLNTAAALVAELLNTVLAALKPVEECISVTPGLGPLLAPFLLPLNTELAVLLNSLFALVADLLNVVLTLLDGTVAPLLRALGLGAILSILTL